MDLDGIEAVRRYRASEAEALQQQPALAARLAELRSKDMYREGSARRLKIISMSANADEETRRDIKEAGADFFLEKPFDLAMLNKAFEQVAVL